MSWDDDFDKQFDKHFSRTQNMILVGWGCGTLVMLAVLGFAGWVIFKLLQHFGVV